ncbi:hypothetical protein DXG03_002299 [Asterophora parasitica]|uniref:Uncharacterized protein n=1 Tax=Asterophora parasitica TaxID=117018 RepID=A0A9P7FXH5_9AGAR|nr:hypothetical protein DXG03_002299 [Asterophora parasitica]
MPAPNLGASDSTDSLHDNPTAHHIPRARADELQGLLAESDSETERMSLHSNPGHGRKRTKWKKDKRTTLFGYDLFGHRPPPIQLPESEDEGTGRSLVVPTPTTRSSSQTFDADAAPLDAPTIATISTSAATLRAREATEEEEQKAEAERRKIRRQRKELKRVAKALALAEEEQDFEGFQGSGSGFPRQEYRSFVHAENDDGEGDAEADLDGGLYARKGTSGTGSGSDSRSRTSASRSQQSQGDLHSPQYSTSHISRQQPLSGHQHGESDSAVPWEKKMKSKSSTATRSTASRASRSNTSSGSTSHSPSLASPVSHTFVGADGFPKLKLRIADDNLDGSQCLSEADLPSPGLRGAFPSPGPGLRGGFPSQGLSGFPSSGFGPPKIERRNSILARGGAFLATRGGTEDVEG